MIKTTMGPSLKIDIGKYSTIVAQQNALWLFKIVKFYKVKKVKVNKRLNNLFHLYFYTTFPSQPSFQKDVSDEIEPYHAILIVYISSELSWLRLQVKFELLLQLFGR
jgi:hypothetical protein